MTSIIRGPVNLFDLVAAVGFFALAWWRLHSRRRIATRAESMTPDAVDPASNGTV